MHDPGQVVYNDSTTLPLASRSSSSATGSTVKESNDDPAPSGGISRNRSRSGTGGAVVSYEKLLNIFWVAHDPTTLNRQEVDFGPNYRSIILYHNDEQKEAAEKSYKDLTRRRVFRSPIVTELVPLTEFYPAEAYHQDYYRNHRGSAYSDIHIVPKLRKLKQKLK